MSRWNTRPPCPHAMLDSEIYQTTLKGGSGRRTIKRPVYQRVTNCSPLELSVFFDDHAKHGFGEFNASDTVQTP